MKSAGKGPAAIIITAVAMVAMAAVVPAMVADAGRGLLLVWTARPAPAAHALPAVQVPAAPASAPAGDPVELARRAVERGLLELATEPDIWNRVSAGNPPPGLRLDAVYKDEELPGSYSVGLSSGPLFGQVTITGVGRVGGEVRSLRAAYDYFPRPLLSDASCSWGAGAPRCP